MDLLQVIFKIVTDAIKVLHGSIDNFEKEKDLFAKYVTVRNNIILFSQHISDLPSYSEIYSEVSTDSPFDHNSEFDAFSSSEESELSD